jgi:hypothetical protein
MAISLGLSALVATAAGCGGGRLAPPTDGPIRLPPVDAREGSVDRSVTDARTEDIRGADASRGVTDGPADLAAADARREVTDGSVDARRPVDAPTADAHRVSNDAAKDTTTAGDAGQSTSPSDAAPDGPLDAGRPYIERACSDMDVCTCASNESCSFDCPAGGCAITCAPGSICAVTCASPFTCSVDCRTGAQCTLACNLGVCAHWFGPANILACDPAGTGCL